MHGVQASPPLHTEGLHGTRFIHFEAAPDGARQPVHCISSDEVTTGIGGRILSQLGFHLSGGKQHRTLMAEKPWGWFIHPTT